MNFSLSVYAFSLVSFKKHSFHIQFLVDTETAAL